MKLRWVIAGVGALIVVAGLVLLSQPVSTTAAGGHAVACGAATKPSADTSLPATCASAVKTRLHWTIPLTVVGMVVMIGGVLTQLQKNSAERS